MTPARWILLVLTVLGWAVAPAAARAETGTCFTSPLPMTDTLAADCADEPDCSTLPDRVLSETGGPTGPRCLEPGPTCHPGHPLLASGPDGFPFVEALRPPAPRRAPASLPLGDPLNHTLTARERPRRPEAPPPRATGHDAPVFRRA